MKNYTNLLNNFYNSIYSNRCEYYDLCHLPCKYELNFYRARIGSNYGKDIPKILIIGKEAVFPKNYNGEKIEYLVKEPVTMADAGYNQHYLRTFYTIAQLLNIEDMPKSYLKDDIGQNKYEYLRHYFALTNFYKCVFTDNIDHSNKKTTVQMEKNCTKMLLKEIGVLKPDIVIFQGKGHPTFWRNNTFDTIEEKKCAGKYFQGLYSAKTGNHHFWVIDSYHPTSRGIWNNPEVHEYFLHLLNLARNEYFKTK